MSSNDLVLLATAAVNFFLGGFILYKNSRKSINRALAGISFCLGLWAVIILTASHVADPRAVKWLARINFFQMGLVPYLFLKFVQYFPGDKPTPFIRKSAAAALVLMMALCLTPLVITDSRTAPGTFEVDYGAMHPVYLFLFSMLFLSVFVMLFAKFRKSYGLTRLQIKYVFAGFVVSATLGITTNLILPLAGIRELVPLGTASAAILVGFLAYAILKHRLLEIETLVIKSFVYFVLTSFITAVYILIVLLFQQAMGGAHKYFLPEIITAVVIALTLTPLKNRLDALTNRIFFQKKYDYQKTLGELSLAISVTVNLDELLEKVLTQVVETMHLEGGSFLLREQISGEYQVKKNAGHGCLKPGVKIPADSVMVSRLNSVNSVIVTEELSATDDTLLLKELSGLNAAICLPIRSKQQMTGILVLGRKKSADIFTSADLALLNTLASEMSIALQNARLYEEMQHKERLVFLGSMAASLGHEIKNPLTSIKLFIELLRSESNDAEFLKKFHEIVPAQIERLNDLSERLLTIARPAQPRPVYLDINEIIKWVVVLFETQAKKKGVQLVPSLTTVPRIMADEQHLIQCFINIILNAIEVLEAGGRLVISNSVKGRLVEIRFADNGPGISAGDQEKIFEPFFSTKRDGTGLGLPICRRLIEAQGGTIRLENTAGKGACFIIDLPVAQEEGGEKSND